jgi:putative ABC transport system ATP-binding protein
VSFQLWHLLSTLWFATYWKLAIIVGSVLVLIGVLFSLSLFVMDTRLHRKFVARRLSRLATRLMQRSTSADVAAEQMISAVNSDYRFEQCYALRTLGSVSLGSRSEGWAMQLREACARTLRSEDPFVRHSAASLFASMGPDAGFATQQLIDTLNEHSDESSGRYAAEALGKILSTQNQELYQRGRMVLLKAIEEDSVAAVSAQTAYDHLSKVPVKPPAYLDTVPVRSPLVTTAQRRIEVSDRSYSQRHADQHQRRIYTGREPLIYLEDVKKIFYTDEVETHALSGIHLDIQQGEYVSIAGPSGCGKSTLLSILGLLDTPTEGKYILNSHPVEELSLSERARIRNREVGFIFQSFNLIGDLTVFENVELPLTYRGMSSSERKKRVTEALERVGMAHRAKHLPSQLSGGQQQRVAAARAIAGQPSILLADEPTGNLDSTNGEAVMELMRELHRTGATICMVTHDPRYAQHADRIIHLFDGLVVEEEELSDRAAAAAKRVMAESGYGLIS